MAKIRCKSCGKFIDENLCPYCGNNNYSSQTVIEPIQKTINVRENDENKKVIVDDNYEQENNTNQMCSSSPSLGVNDKRIYVALSLIMSIFSLMGIFPVIGAIISITLANKYKKSGDTEYLKYVSIGKALAIAHLVIVGITTLMTFVPLITGLIN